MKDTPNKESYDIIVAGAGLAGAAAAWFAAKGGVSVLLVEREKVPGYPTRCAEGIYFKDTDIEIPQDCIAKLVSGLVLHAPGGEELIFDNIGSGAILHRTKFIQYLVDNAISSGAELITEASVVAVQDCLNHQKSQGNTTISSDPIEQRSVTIKTADASFEVKCKILIAADGIESRLSELAGLKTKLSTNEIEAAYQYRICHPGIDPDRLHIYIGRDIAPGGYAWVFPKGDFCANGGLAICPDLAKGKTAKEYCDNFIKSKFPEFFGCEGETRCSIQDPVAGGIPIAVPERIYSDGFMLAGDAARMVNPLTGAGIGTALFSGKNAGIIAAKAVKAGNCSSAYLKVYQQKWNKRYGSLHKTMLILANKAKKMSDTRADELISMLGQVPSEARTLKSFFITLLKNKPSLLIKVTKSYLFGS